PRAPLFPYTTLFRSVREAGARWVIPHPHRVRRPPSVVTARGDVTSAVSRSRVPATGLMLGGLAVVAALAQAAPVLRIVRVELESHELAPAAREVVSNRCSSRQAQHADGIAGEHTLTEPSMACRAVWVALGTPVPVRLPGVCLASAMLGRLGTSDHTAHLECLHLSVLLILNYEQTSDSDMQF